jgi:DMSO/TMAO reductase YedYZ molybdopterin-dependent catalytic subunit
MSVLSRRRFLGGTLAGAAGALVGCSSGEPRTGFLGAMERVNERVQGWLFSEGRDLPRFPDSALTPEGKFPVYHASPFPPPPPAGWALVVGGKVSRPRRFSLDELQRLPRTDLRIEHHCVEGWSAVADWHGVRITEIAQLVGADPRAAFVDFRSFDAGYWSSWDRASALSRHTILAYGMNGRDLPITYGAPVRVYSGLKLGYKNVKYLTEVNFLDAPTGGYWENTGYEWYAGT